MMMRVAMDTPSLPAFRLVYAVTNLLTSHFVFLAIVLLATGVLQRVFRTNPLADFPTIGQGWEYSRRRHFASGGAPWFYAEGYRKFKNGVFRLATTRKSETLVVSPRFLNELGRLPDDVLSFDAANAEFLQAKYTHIQTQSHVIPATVKKRLTPSLPRISSMIAHEAVHALQSELPAAINWTEIDVQKSLIRIISIVSGRVFVGPELCRDEKFLDAAMNYTIDIMIAIHIIDMIPSILRPILAPLLPPVWKLQRRTMEMNKSLGPVVKTRRLAEADPGYQKPDDMLQWLMDSQQAFGRTDDRELAKDQLSLCFAAIHTTGTALTNALHELAPNPDLVSILREDIQQALALGDGKFSSTALQKMKKLDSFVKEIFRCYPVLSSSFQRKVLKPFTLSSGQTIPAGVIIEAPAKGISTDPDIFENPEAFDGLRHFKLRESLERDLASNKADSHLAVAKTQSVSVSTTDLTFGYGRHACPGRFYAINEIKMILAALLLRYDLKMPGGRTARYDNMNIGLHVSLKNQTTQK